MKIKIAIGIPNTGMIKAQTAFCLFRALKDLPYDYDVVMKEGSILHWNRESLAMKAIELGCTHLLFVDTDMYFEKDAITRLVKRNKDIIGVNAHLRTIPAVSTLKVDEGVKLEGKKLVKCNGVGTGFTLIKTDVFKNISHPYFFWEVDEMGQVVTGEDFWFCRKAREAGYDVWADLTIPVLHIGDYKY